MSHIELTDKLEGFRTRNSNNHCYINRDVYRLLYDKDLYFIAYNRLKSNKGAETEGSDGTSLHGFCEDWIDELITSFRDESYQPNPSRSILIPKKNGKMRRLSFPNGKDKIVQECVHIILDCIYEPTFSNLSHGFRPNRSIHSALAQVSTWNATVWFIEGDISACFDEVDHRILENILRERINDERFIRLINKLLRAGYFDTDLHFHPTKQSTGQGSTCSPILANIYLDKLDRYMEQVIERDTLGIQRKHSTRYNKLRYQLKKAKDVHDIPLIKKINKELNDIKVVDEMDSNFRRIHYVRYADDFLIGTISSKEYAVKLKEEIKEFLENELHLRLSETKTKITSARFEEAQFLGYFLQKKYFKVQTYIDMNRMIHKLHDNGMCKLNGEPTSVTKWFNLSIEEIITKGNNILRGLINNNQCCIDFHKCWRVQYIIQFSIAKTLARKFDTSIKKLFKKHGECLKFKYTNPKGQRKTIKLALYNSFRFDETFFRNWLIKIKTPITVEYKTRSPLIKCYRCGTPNNLAMYHRKVKSRMKVPYPNVEKEMLRINRRQLCLCRDCFKKAIHEPTVLFTPLKRKLV